MTQFEPMVWHIPVGKSGIAEVKRFWVDEQAFSYMRMRESATCGRESAIPIGSYIQLLIQNKVVMSDTELEETTNLQVVLQAHGDVLIAGLGLGYILIPILAKEYVKSVLVVEKHQDVINLVEPHIRHPKLTVVNGDIFTFKTKATFDTIYFDIWPNICRDNLPEMKRLERRFRPKLNEKGWIGSWAKIRCMRNFR
jgi:spermidine synthase